MRCFDYEVDPINRLLFNFDPYQAKWPLHKRNVRANSFKDEIYRENEGEEKKQRERGRERERERERETETETETETESEIMIYDMISLLAIFHKSEYITMYNIRPSPISRAFVWTICILRKYSKNGANAWPT